MNKYRFFHYFYEKTFILVDEYKICCVSQKKKRIKDLFGQRWHLLKAYAKSLYINLDTKLETKKKLRYKFMI